MEMARPRCQGSRLKQEVEQTHSSALMVEGSTVPSPRPDPTFVSPKPWDSGLRAFL